jgi:Ca2+-transporting ATPase
VLAELGGDARHGLTSAEAASRRAREGANVISTRRGRPWWVRALLQFHAPLVYILLVACVVTLLLEDYVDSAVIFAVVLVNAVIGYVQETRAVKAIDALSRAMKIEATVLRDGQRLRVDAADLVRGDVVFIEPGDKVPADLRLLTERELRVDESMLTGESKAVAKRTDVLDADAVLAERTNLAFAGSLVVRGTGTGVVIETGDRTEVGRISEMIAHADDLATPLTRKIAQFSTLLLWLVLGVAAATFVVGLLRGYAWVDMFKASVALAVGAIPEGLPAAVTIMLAVGVAQMARRRAIIRKLPAVEALGSTTVICSDKTGTLTQNQMTVRAAWCAGLEFEFTGIGYDPAGEVRLGATPVRGSEQPVLRELLVCGVLCNDSSLRRESVDESTPREAGRAGWSISGDPTEAALIVAARKLGVDGETLTQDALAREFPRLDAIPFESDRQYMATLHAVGERGRVVYVKGSVERVLAMCTHALGADGRTIEPLDRDAVLAHTAALARRGLRVLAFARRRVPDSTDDLTHPMVEHAAADTTDPAHAMVFLGVQGMLDPPREEAIRAVAACQRAGVRVKMITGDHAATAATIAGMLGIDGVRGNDEGTPSVLATSPAGRADAATPASTPPVLTGAEMAAIPDESLAGVAERTNVFARMTPEQKLRLVKALQSRGHIVAMTGDGVNDAPALRQADIGVAMGITGTEAAKDAADMVLADDNFATIEAAIEEGRGVYANLTKFIVWTLPTNGGEALVILAAIVLGWPLPILPVQALYINMITAILLGMPLIFEKKDHDVMLRPPRDPKRPLFTFEMLMRTGLVSILLAGGAMAMFHWELARGSSEATARAAAVAVIVIGKIPYLFSARALVRPAWSIPVFSNMLLWAGIGTMLVVQYAFAHLEVINRLFHSAPMDASSWGGVFLVALAVLVIVEAEKAIRRALTPALNVENA